MSEAIICYDIACPRRLARIYRQLKKRACPLQYSVFLFTGSDVELQHCLATLQELMDPRHDDIRAYPLPQRGLRLVRRRSMVRVFMSGCPDPETGVKCPASLAWAPCAACPRSRSRRTGGNDRQRPDPSLAAGSIRD